MKQIQESMPKKLTAFAKKLLVPAVFLLLLSCSKDDDKAPEVTPIPTVPSFLKATINGTSYNFNSFVVETQTVVEPDYTYVDLHVIAKIQGDETKRIEFNLEQDVAGSETIYFFYLFDSLEYDTDHTGAAFNTLVTVNSNKRIIGTFSGTLADVDNSTTVEITNGSFDITY